ncbi:MAG TPA: hypothetical protein VFZ81_00795, partial [Burkholderiales bacterium]
MSAASASPAGLPAGIERVAAGGELSLGQILKARVLKHHEGNRYLVSLQGRERVVDSSIPLTVGEVVRGRVVAVGDRVELQPLPEARAEAVAPAQEPAAAPP